MTKIYQYFSKGFNCNIVLWYRDGILCKVEIEDPQLEFAKERKSYFITHEADFLSGCKNNNIPFTEVQREVTFDMFWKKYNYAASGKIPAQNAWKKLTVQEQQQAFDYIAMYEGHLKQTQTAKKYGSTYLNSKIYIK